jgi:hypothetical protein
MEYSKVSSLFSLLSLSCNSFKDIETKYYHESSTTTMRPLRTEAADPKQRPNSGVQSTNGWYDAD